MVTKREKRDIRQGEHRAICLEGWLAGRQSFPICMCISKKNISKHPQKVCNKKKYFKENILVVYIPIDPKYTKESNIIGSTS